ncbi:MAG: glycosyltransferase family 39 protein [Magnetococcales bacterium]|nr:glycosyltransferase family 39 protein [Magnetococcales bacterium]
MRNRYYAQLSLVILISALYSRELFNENLFYPDASHLMLDGVFIADYVRELLTNGFTNPMDYAIRYFGQYPALSIGYKPPLWPAIQALFMLIFGVAPWVMRLALLVLAIFGAIALYRTIERGSGVFVAWVSTALALSIPYLVQWGWYAMTELSALIFVLSAGWPLSRYLEERRHRYLVYMVLLLAAGVWCKQTAAVGALWVVLAAVLSLGIKETFRRREVWAAMVAYFLLIAPVIWLTIEFGKKNLSQAVNKELQTSVFVSSNNVFLKYIDRLFSDQLSALFVSAAIAGILLALWRLRQGVDPGLKRNIILFLSLIISTYIFFTILNGKNPRYTVFWLPGFGYFAGFLIGELRRHYNSLIAGAGFALLLATNVVQSFAMLPREVTGMVEAADYVVENAEFPVVMVDSYINAHFIYLMRQKDPERQFWIVRGDKVLSVAGMVHNANHGNVTTFAESADDIKNILHQYGVKYIVVDKIDLIGVPIHESFREYLLSDDFRLLKEITTSSNRDKRYDNGQSVNIYEFLEWREPTSKSITIQVPIVGKTFTVPLADFKSKKQMKN